MDKLFDQGSRSSFGYALDKDPMVGFKEASRNAQTRLALEYASVLLSQFAEQIASLEQEVKNLKKASSAAMAPAPAPAPVKKAAVKKAPAKKV